MNSAQDDRVLSANDVINLILKMAPRLIKRVYNQRCKASNILAFEVQLLLFPSFQVMYNLIVSTIFYPYKNRYR